MKLFNKKRIFFFLILAGGLTLGLSSNTLGSFFSFSPWDKETISLSEAEIDSVIVFGKQHLGKPYRSLSPDGRILDCSGFVSYIYNQQGVELPRSSPEIARKTKKVTLLEVKKGDLLFFKGRNSKSSTIGHVAIISAVLDDTIEMLHSCNRGIRIEKLNGNTYYTQRFLFAGRLPQCEGGTPNNLLAKGNTNTINIPDSLALLGDTIPASIKIMAVGDMMLGTNYPNSSYLPPNDGKDLLNPVKHILKNGTIVFGNLEGVLLTGDGPVKSCSDPKSCYAFKMPDHYAKYISEAHFNLLSVANNHVNDFGAVGAKNTMEQLKNVGIPHAGLKDCPFTTFEKDGLKYGFAAFAPNTGTISINDYDNALKIVSSLDTLCDIVIVSFHGGAEGPSKKHITRQREFFLGEDRGNPYEFARMMIDAGADMVFGHGPHVARAIDVYKERIIAYSLGNFATYGRFNLTGPNGIAPILEVDVDYKGKFIKGKIHATKQLGEGGPVVDEENAVIKDIIALSREDFPESVLTIDETGNLYYKPR
jgi:poly-gamma-glutamate capsule biosynthesis protein CapA/YwtB (metallophosphatase superfamily)